MKAAILSLTLAFALAPACFAQTDFRLFGNSGSEASLTPPNGSSPLNPGNVLNVERRSDSSDLSLFGEAAPESKSWKLGFKVRSSGAFGRDSTGRLEIDELSGSVSVTNWLDLRAGRKIEKWGTGYAWNPTGVVNPPKDPRDPGDRLNRYRGVDMFGADVFVRGWTVSLLGVPQIDWTARSGRRLLATGWAARASGLVKGADVSFTGSGGNGLPNSYGLSLARVFGKALELHGEAARFNDTLRGVPYGGEFRLRRRPHSEVLLGGQYTFPRNVNLVLEYFHAGAGLNAREWREFRSLAATVPLQANANFAPLAMGTDYSFVRAFWPIRLNKLEAEMIVISSLRDGSSALRPALYWKIRPDWSLYWIQTEFLGAPRTEMGHIQIRRSSQVGIRYYFSFRKKERGPGETARAALSEETPKWNQSQ